VNHRLGEVQSYQSASSDYFALLAAEQSLCKRQQKLTGVLMKKVQSVGKIGLNLQQPLSRKDEEWLQKKVKRRVEQGSVQCTHASWDGSCRGDAPTMAVVCIDEAQQRQRRGTADAGIHEQRTQRRPRAAECRKANPGEGKIEPTVWREMAGRPVQWIEMTK
jgi:hypothetical protein